MKKVLLLVLLTVFGQMAFAQIGWWAWVAGDSIVNATSIYGTQGVSSIINKPGARQASMAWIDTANNFWMYGGQKYPASAISDLWKYNSTTNVWAWMKGDTIAGQPGVYGTKGVASAGNKPGARLSAATWKDDSYLYFFGGATDFSSIANNYNDLWKYNIASNEWTWINGDNTPNQNGIYGTKGVSNATNKPGARFSSTEWTDYSGNVWIYGGTGYSASSQGYLNDLWKYNPVTNEWTWMNGNNIASTYPVFGTQGVANAANTPGARFGSSGWTDNAGNLWLFGGEVVYTASGGGPMNDLWKFDVLTNEWAWINGDTLANRNGFYGTQNVASSLNKPGGRMHCASFGGVNEFYLFGGVGIALPNDVYSDVWKYTTGSNQWTWIKGDSGVYNYANYGVKGISTPTNAPGSHALTGYASSNSDIYVFGGYGFTSNQSGNVNDLWAYRFQGVIIPVHLLTFTAQLKDNNTLLNWQVENEQNFDRYQIERSPNGKDFTNIGAVKAVNRKEYSFTDNNPTTTPNSKPQTIFYRLKLIDRDGQFTYSPIRQININHSTLNIAPNPVSNWLQVQVKSEKPGNVTWQVTDMQGRVVMQQTRQLQAGANTFSINTLALAKGEYILSVQGETSVQKTFTKQ